RARLFTRPVAFILAGDMAVAYFMAHAPRGFFPLLNAGEWGDAKHIGDNFSSGQLCSTPESGPQRTNRRGARHQLVQQLECFGPEFTVVRVEAREVTSRPIEAGNKSKLHGVSGDDEHNWDAGGRSLRGESRNHTGRDDHSHLNLVIH